MFSHHLWTNSLILQLSRAIYRFELFVQRKKKWRQNDNFNLHFDISDATNMINDSFTQGNELSFSWKIVEFSQMKIYVIWNHISFGNKKKRNLSCWISSKNIKCARKYPALVKLISSQMCTWHVESHMAPAIRYTHQWYISLYYMWTYSALANGFDWIVRIGPHEVDGGDRLLIIAHKCPKIEPALS